MFRINGILTTSEGKKIAFDSTMNRDGARKALEQLKKLYDVVSVCNNTTGVLEFGGPRVMELGKPYVGGKINGVLKSIR